VRAVLVVRTVTVHSDTVVLCTGRGLITEHQSFLKNFQQFDRSHFMLGMELMSALLVVRVAFGRRCSGCRQSVELA
jgi:hypothetical protein